MSTSICQPLDLVSRRDRSYSSLPKVKRALFCVDAESASRYAQNELAKEIAANSIRWNFDFETESTLNPNGTFIWKRVEETFIGLAPRKRKLDESEGFESEQYYFQPIEPNKEKARSQGRIEQRLITDYMPTKKRTIMEPIKKSNERPVKLPRLNELS